MLPETGGGILTEKYYNYIYISSPIPFIIFGRFSMIAFELQLPLALVVGCFFVCQQNHTSNSLFE